MKISVITPTCDRPIGIKYLEKYMKEQTVQPDEWIVCDGGEVPAELTIGQIHSHNASFPGAQNLMGNILRGLRMITGDVIFIFEDDDVYLPDHIEKSLHHLQYSDATGGSRLKYFNVQHRCWIDLANRGSALCQTSFNRRLLPVMENSAIECFRSNNYSLDGVFWQRSGCTPAHMETVIGIKGLPGTKGLGIGHRPDPVKKNWVFDHEFAKLVEWIGEERTSLYTKLY